MRKDLIFYGSMHDIDGIPGGDRSLKAVFEMPTDIFPSNCNTIVFDKRIHKLTSKLTMFNEGKPASEVNADYWDTLTYSKLDEIFGQGHKDYVPLFYVNIEDNKANIMSQLRYTESDIVYMFIGSVSENLDYNHIYEEALKMHAQEHVFLDNYQCYYRKMRLGTEIEYKYNILSDTDPWIIANDFFTDLNEGNIPDYVCEYGDVLQKWDYMNYMFFVYGEGEGYISVIPQTNGKYLLKRKIYKEDSLERIELHYKDEVIEGSFKEHLEKKFNVTCAELPPFRTIRYDIDMENVKTGNIFGVFFDYISIEGKPNILKQCEIEYLRTRSLKENDEYPREQLELKEFVTNYMKNHGVDFEETFYSKLSFLLDSCGVKRIDYK